VASELCALFDTKYANEFIALMTQRPTSHRTHEGGQAVVQVARTSPSDRDAELFVLGWMQSQESDETSMFAAFFEEHGYLGARSNAVDIVAAAVIGLDHRHPVVWPLIAAAATAAEIGGSGMVVMDGVVRRDGLYASTVLCPVNDRLVSLTVSSIAEQISAEPAPDSPWIRVQVWGRPTRDVGPWLEARRQARLALASELVGVSRRIIDCATIRIGSPRGPGPRVVGEQAARSNLMQVSAKLTAVRVLIAACWANGSVEAADEAVAVAIAAHDAAAHHVALVCGELNLALLHPMRFLLEEGSRRIPRFPITRTAVPPVLRP
jgi:hypothetical protein